MRKLLVATFIILVAAAPAEAAPRRSPIFIGIGIGLIAVGAGLAAGAIWLRVTEQSASTLMDFKHQDALRDDLVPAAAGGFIAAAPLLLIGGVLRASELHDEAVGLRVRF